MAYGGVSLQDTGGTVKLRPDGTYNITVPEEHYVEMTITFRSDFGFLLCFVGIYFEVRDGLNQSANLLGVICEAYTKEHAFRSSGQNMYLKLHGGLHKSLFHINYTAKPMNITGFYSFIDPFCKIISLLSTYNRQQKLQN